jgi:hypothetical protein
MPRLCSWIRKLGLKPYQALALDPLNLVTAIDLASLSVEILPEDGESLTDPFAGCEHELADIDEICPNRSLILPEELEPLFALLLSQ